MLRISSQSRSIAQPSALALTVAAAILVYGNNQSVGLAIPIFLTRDLGGDPSTVGVVAAVSTGGAILGRWVARQLVVRWSPLKTVIVGVLAVSIVTGLYLILESTPMIAVARFLHLGAFALVTSTATIAAARLAGPDQQTRALAAIGLAMPASALVFPAVASEALDADLPAVAVVATVLSLIAAVALTSAARLGTGHRCDVQLLPIDPAAPGRIPVSALMAAFVIGMTDAVVTDLLPVLGAQRGISGFGLFYTVFALVMIATLLFLRRSRWVWPAAMIVTAGLSVASIGFVLLTIADSLALFSIAAMAYGCGFALSQTALAVWLTTGATGSDRGRRLAGLYLVFDLGRAGGIFGTGSVATAAGFTVTLLVVAVCCALAAAAVRVASGSGVRLRTHGLR